MNFTLDDDEMTQLDFADMRMHDSNKFAIQVSTYFLLLLLRLNMQSPRYSSYFLRCERKDAFSDFERTAGRESHCGAVISEK
jgi:hypothetical protein